MQNDKIKEYWEGEAGIYSEGIKAELQSETAENWKKSDSGICAGKRTSGNTGCGLRSWIF